MYVFIKGTINGFFVLCLKSYSPMSILFKSGFHNNKDFLPRTGRTLLHLPDQSNSVKLFLKTL